MMAKEMPTIAGIRTRSWSIMHELCIAWVERVPQSIPFAISQGILGPPTRFFWQLHTSENGFGLDYAALDLRYRVPQLLRLRALGLSRRLDDAFESPPVHSEPQG
jgi:hypothetical protein